MTALSPRAARKRMTTAVKDRRWHKPKWWARPLVGGLKMNTKNSFKVRSSHIFTNLCFSSQNIWKGLETCWGVCDDKIWCSNQISCTEVLH